MKISSVQVKNFKTIVDATVELADFNVIVGGNGSGKSSLLQAMHWVFQSGRNPTVVPTAEETKGRTLSEKDATYMPSPDYSNTGNAGHYGNTAGTPQLDVVVKAQGENNEIISAHLWLKSARNEGLSVHVPSANAFTIAVRDQSREFSAYIPGLAGIPLAEEKRSTAIVHRLAAAGDANTVLRNVLLLLKNTDFDGQTGLQILQEYLSRVLGKNITLTVDFDELKDSTIKAQFQHTGMTQSKPLEIAGIGFLQIAQIFAYLLYFRPRLILIDEPDAHLHLTAQEALIPVLVDASAFTKTQVVITTHSPSVVRALPSEAKVIWMKDGKPQPNGDTDGRRLMGWGLLDRRFLLITEDEDAGMLRSILAQWPSIDRQVAIWPVRSSSKIPEAEVIRDFLSLTGESLKIVVHRDRDFLMPVELDAIRKPYHDVDQFFWETMFSDVEAYWINRDTIVAHFGIENSDADSLLSEAMASVNVNDEALKKRRKKRNDNAAKINKQGELPVFGDAEVEAEAAKHGAQYAVLGKDLMKAIRKAGQDRKYKNSGSFGITIPTSVSGTIASDLHDLLAGLN